MNNERNSINNQSINHEIGVRMPHRKLGTRQGKAVSLAKPKHHDTSRNDPRRFPLRMRCAQHAFVAPMHNSTVAVCGTSPW